MVAAVPVIGALAAVGTTLLNSDSDPAYALTELGDGTIRVEVYPDFDDVDGLENDLANAGVDAEVVSLRAHPDLVGIVEVASHDNEAAGALEIDGNEFVVEVRSLVGPIEILVYSPAGNSDYQASPSIFAAGQPLAGLHCTYTEGPLGTADLEQAAIEAGIEEFSWTWFGELDEDTGEIATETHNTRPEGSVSGAQMRNDDQLDVFVSETEKPAADWIEMTDGTHDRNRPDCTPELAARWE